MTAAVNPVLPVNRYAPRMGKITKTAPPRAPVRARNVHDIRSLGLDLERFNVNGSSIALGHPMGATGAMLVRCLLDEMQARGLRYGVAALPGAFGVATATVFERVA